MCKIIDSATGWRIELDLSYHYAYMITLHFLNEHNIDAFEGYLRSPEVI